jgi:nitrate/nitrite transporter NarK
MDKDFKRKGWIVLSTATGINFLAGLLYIWSIIGKGLIDEFGWTSKQASLPYTVAIMFFAISMVAFGKVQDTRGPRVAATISGILMGIGLILSGLTTNPILMILTFGVITGAGVGISAIATTPAVVKWFPPDKKGLVTGIVVAGVGIASVAYSPITNALITSVGVSKTFIYIGIVVFVLVILLAQLLKNPPVDCDQRKGKANAGRSSGFGLDIPWKELLRSVDFLKLWIMMAFSASAGLMIIGHLASITKTQALWDGGYLLVIFLAVFNTAGRILGGIVSDKIGQISLLRWVFIIQALNMLFFKQYTSVGLLSIGVAVAGICYGAGFSVFPAAVLHRYGAKYFGTNYGLIMTAWGFAGIVGPMTAAAIFDSTSSYDMSYYISCALLIITTILTFTFTKVSNVHQSHLDDTGETSNFNGKRAVIT